MGEGADRARCDVDDQHHDSSHGENALAQELREIRLLVRDLVHGALAQCLFGRSARSAIKKGRPSPPLLSAARARQTAIIATILWLRSTMMISSPTTKYIKPRHSGWISMSSGGTATTRTLVGTVVPTFSEKLTLEARGTLLPAKTVCLILVRCSVVRLTLPPA